MGTRSITRILADGKPLLTFYRQFDGYPSGHGKELAEFIAGITIVNGYNPSMRGGTHANGAGCFAGQLVAKLKLDGPDSRGGIGGIYIREHEAENEEYTYTINFQSQGAGFDCVDVITNVKCEGYDEGDSYDGNVAGFIEFCERAE